MKRHYPLSGVIIAILFFAVSFTGNTQQANLYLSFEDGLQQPTDQVNTTPSRETINGDEEYYKINFSFHSATVANTIVEGKDYQFLHIDGFIKMGLVGAPALPLRKEVIAMPPGAAGKISIVNSTYFEYDGYMIHPALEPARDTEGAPEPEFWIDEKVYNTDAFFPANIVEITDVALMRGVPLAYTEIRPVQFNPVTKKIRVYTQIEFRLDYQGDKASFSNIAEGNSLHFTNLLKRNVINSDNIPDGSSNTDSKAGEKNYIIITHAEYLSAANDLAAWKRQLGYSVEVVSQSSWTAAQVKTAIENLYDSWNPKPDYFLIIGDHTGSYAVPGDVVNTPYSPPDDGPFATDLYFACMDGSSDWHPDMAHGRISVSSSTEAQIVVDKIINYEKIPPTQSSFYTNVLNCAQYQDDDNNGYADRRFCHTTEDIRDYLQDYQGYSSTRVYHTDATTPLSTRKYNNGLYSDGQLIPTELRNASFNWAGGATEITSEWNAGKFLVFHRDHGYTGGSGWHRPYYTTTSMNSLSNGDLLPVVFSINCHTGEYQLSNCFAEKLTRMQNKGAVGVIAAAYFSLSGWNDAMSLGMIDAIWSDPGIYGNYGTGGTTANYTIGAGNNIYTMGDIMNQGLYAMEQNWHGGYAPATADILHQYEYELFMYFGDPAMKIWTENPNNNVITATHNDDIDCSLTSFSISNSTAGATATLVFDEELIGETVLDGSGNGTINYTITSPGLTVLLTISKTNHKPYEADLNLIGSCNPPIVETDPATAVTQTSATMHGEILNDFSNTVTESGFVYGTSLNPIIGGPGVTKLQTSPTVTMGTFSLPLSGLSPATTYYFRAYAITAGGTGYGSNENFSTLCGMISSLPYTQDFSSGALPACWQNIDNQGSGQVWEFDNPGGRTLGSSTGANGFAILDSDFYGSGGNQDADLITPEFDFSGYVSVNLSFEHYYRSYSGSSGTLSYSINGGSSWNIIQTWTVTTANAVSFNQDMTSDVAGESSVMFKWNYTGSWGYYWFLDDLSITGVEGSPSMDQVTDLVGGWNILSFCVTPSSTDMMDIVQALVDGGMLVKITDEAGGFVQYIPGPGWMNTIGDMSNTEGYYINLSSASSITTNGTPVSYPFDIPLIAGWNIMGYPCDVSQDAISVLQPLIDDGYLVKVLSESGGIIQNIPVIGWLNTIVNFEPGEGYYINVNTASTLTLTDPSKSSAPQSYPVPEPPTDFFAGYNSNPFTPMNIVIRDIHSDGFKVEDGDEIAVYDGDLQVGSAVIVLDGKGYHSIIARTDDPITEMTDGFIKGNEITFKLWDKSEDVVYSNIEATHILGDQKFNPLGTFMGDLKVSSLGIGDNGIPKANYLDQNFPNPFSERTRISYGIAEDADVTLSVYDISGRLVMVLQNSHLPAGKYFIEMKKESLEPGIYYYSIEVIGSSTRFRDTRKMMLF